MRFKARTKLGLNRMVMIQPVRLHVALPIKMRFSQDVNSDVLP